MLQWDVNSSHRRALVCRKRPRSKNPTRFRSEVLVGTLGRCGSPWSKAGVSLTPELL